MTITRRSFVDRLVHGTALTLSFQLGGAAALLTPQQARAKQVPLRKLSADQARTLELLADAILPGAAALGVVHFIDHQLSAEPQDALLIAKYFQVAPPYLDFYAAGVRTADALARRSAGKAVAQLDGEKLRGLLGQVSKPGTVADGFPVFLFYMCLRSDAVDVVYGTPQGFKKLNVPYMEHIMPPGGWDG